MKAGKPFIVYTVGVCLLALGGTILTVINFIDIIRFPPQEVDLTFIVASAFFIVGVGCLVLLIKKLFLWLTMLRIWQMVMLCQKKGHIGI